jgi:hypothetical protein
MHTHPFSNAQASHALEVVLALMKERRFFLYRQELSSQRIEGDLGHGLDPAIFGEALKLDEDVRTAYAEATRQGEKVIAESEQKLGIKAPDLSANRKLVQCNRFTGGLDICRVYPIAAFIEFAPASIDDLPAQEIKRLMGYKTADDYSPKGRGELQECARVNACKIWKEIEAIKALKPGNSCMVLLKTRFEPSGGHKEDDFLEGRIADIRLFPHGMGYLFYQYSKRTRIVRHAHVVFNTSRSSHVNVQHWFDKEPSLAFDSEGGYNCHVYIPLVL